MTRISFIINDASVRRIFNSRFKQDAVLRDAIIKIGDAVATHVRAAAPRSPRHRGRGQPLADSFATRNFAKSVVVRSYKPYAAIMEVGGTTPEHVILPKKANALAFDGIFAKRVQHPGAVYVGKHFAAKVARKDRPMIEEKLASAVMRSLR